jgi:hypothetical protein
VTRIWATNLTIRASALASTTYHTLAKGIGLCRLTIRLGKKLVSGEDTHNNASWGIQKRTTGFIHKCRMDYTIL